MLFPGHNSNHSSPRYFHGPRYRQRMWKLTINFMKQADPVRIRFKSRFIRRAPLCRCRAMGRSSMALNSNEKDHICVPWIFIFMVISPVHKMAGIRHLALSRPAVLCICIIVKKILILSVQQKSNNFGFSFIILYNAFKSGIHVLHPIYEDVTQQAMHCFCLYLFLLSPILCFVRKLL